MTTFGLSASLQSLCQRILQYFKNSRYMSNNRYRPYRTPFISIYYRNTKVSYNFETKSNRAHVYFNFFHYICVSCSRFNSSLYVMEHVVFIMWFNSQIIKVRLCPITSHHIFVKSCQRTITNGEQYFLCSFIDRNLFLKIYR